MDASVLAVVEMSCSLIDFLAIRSRVLGLPPKFLRIFQEKKEPPSFHTLSFSRSFPSASEVFRSRTSPDAIDLVSQLLQYDPEVTRAGKGRFVVAQSMCLLGHS